MSGWCSPLPRRSPWGSKPSSQTTSWTSALPLSSLRLSARSQTDLLLPASLPKWRSYVRTLLPSEWRSRTSAGRGHAPAHTAVDGRIPTRVDARRRPTAPVCVTIMSVSARMLGNAANRAASASPRETAPPASSRGLLRWPPSCQPFAPCHRPLTPLTRHRFLIDTGAEVSVLPATSADRRRPSQLEITLRAINGSSIASFGTRSLTVSLDCDAGFSLSLSLQTSSNRSLEQTSFITTG